MTEESKVRCQTPKKIPTYDYPEAIEYVEKQHHIFWLPTEPKIEKDLHCIKTELTDAEKHGVITTLMLFVKYEQVAGNEYWGDRFKRIFPRPEFERLGGCYSNVELNIHWPFYQRVDEILGLNTDEFYNSFTEDEVLVERMGFLDNCISDEEDLFSVGSFSMVEGSILYSSFAYLSHFQAEGKNKLTNIHSGITFSVKDENMHSEAGAWSFRTLLSEEQARGRYLPDSAEYKNLVDKLVGAANRIYEHEKRIIEMVFSEGSVKGITPKQMKNFVKSRINLCLQNLGLNPIFEVTYNPIAKWFYNMIGSDAQNDFFNSLGSAYNRNWSEKGFTWGDKEVV